MGKGLRLTEAEAKNLGIGQTSKAAEPDPDECPLTANQVASHIRRNYKLGYQRGFAERAKGQHIACALCLFAGWLAGFIIALMAVHRL